LDVVVELNGAKELRLDYRTTKVKYTPIAIINKKNYKLL